MTHRRIAILAGIPGTGKTTIFREVLRSTETEYQKLRPLIDGMVTDSLVVLGDYRDQEKPFVGTDTWSMAAQRESDIFFEENHRNVLLEGDRIFNGKTIRRLQALDYEILLLVLETAQEEVQRRYQQRGSSQSEKFIQGRATKIQNIVETPEFESVIRHTQHETPEDTGRIAEALVEFVQSGTIHESLELRERERLDYLFE